MTGDVQRTVGSDGHSGVPPSFEIPFLGKTVTEHDGISVAIPEGRVGELRCAFKAGCDCMGVIYARSNSQEFQIIGNCHDGTQTGDRARHRFAPGVWNLWVYNKTRETFETMMKKTVSLADGGASFVLGATHRVTATHKTCIVCVVDLVPQQSNHA